MAWKGAEVMRSDNLDIGSVPDWVYRVDSPPDEPYQTLTAQTSRDAVLALVVGFAAGRVTA